jgi:hypothetical protein
MLWYPCYNLSWCQRGRLTSLFLFPSKGSKYQLSFYFCRCINIPLSTSPARSLGKNSRRTLLVSKGREITTFTLFLIAILLFFLDCTTIKDSSARLPSCQSKLKGVLVLLSLSSTKGTKKLFCFSLRLLIAFPIIPTSQLIKYIQMVYLLLS